MAQISAENQMVFSDRVNTGSCYHSLDRHTLRRKRLGNAMSQTGYASVSRPYLLFPEKHIDMYMIQNPFSIISLSSPLKFFLLCPI